VNPLSGVLVDACGWIAVVDARINIDLALEQEVGPVELKVTAAVFEELDRVANRENRNLLLDLLRSRAEIVTGSGGHTDDELIELAVAQDWPVLTVDRRLKARLHAANASVIEVMSSRNLRLID
jgi:rRNA-processing protein FCF1